MTDLGSVLGSLFSASSSTGVVLAALARDSQRGTTSIAHLARQVDLSESKALREVNRLIEQGLVVTELRGRHRHVTLNAGSPFYGPLLEMLYLAYGVRQHPERADEHVLRRSAELPFQFVDLIPDELHPTNWGPGRLFADDDDHGPEAPQARVWERKLIELVRQASQPQGRLQDAYSTWRHERDRDLIHQTLHLGAAARYAAEVLARASDHVTVASRVAGTTRVGRKEWKLAVATTRAEATKCHTVMTRLERAIDLARTRNARLSQVDELEASPGYAEAVEAAAHDDSDLDTFHRFKLDERRSKRTGLDDLERQMSDAYRTGGHGVRIGEVGAAGERLIVAQLRSVSATASEYADEMERMLDADQYSARSAQLDRNEVPS